MRRCSLLAIAALTVGLGAAAPAAGWQEPIGGPGNRAAARVTSVAGFTFHSDFWLNLHDYLYGIAGGGPFPRGGFEHEEESCFAALEGDAAAGWRAAEELYRAEMGQRHHRRDPLIRSLRYSWTGLAPADMVEDPGLPVLARLLDGAAPAYRRCLWALHDARNRRWIERIAGLLEAHGAALQTELAGYYQAPWPADNVVDVVSYSDYAGMNTASGRTLPAHTTMASAQPEIEGLKGLEMVLHEASHKIFGFRWGPVTLRLLAVCEELGVEMPRDLWHALSFYTSGEAVARVGKDAGEADFAPYARRTGMWEWAYPGYLEPIERHWRPYLAGDVELGPALTGLVSAITAAAAEGG